MVIKLTTFKIRLIVNKMSKALKALKQSGMHLLLAFSGRTPDEAKVLKAE